jgi:aspartate carbamoyltransferase catalytic subunit
MKHLLSASDLSKDNAIELLNLATVLDQPNSERNDALKGVLVANLFFEDSTRTRFSFELAAKRLSADVINFTSKGSSVSKGESLKDTILTLEAMGVEAFVIRHHHSGAAQTIADSSWSKSIIINAGDGTHQHPTQALSDALTIRQSLNGLDNAGDLQGLRVLIVGDILHSRVARSNIALLKTLGANVSLCGPSTLVPSSAQTLVEEIHYDFDRALNHEFDVVMMLRIQSERMHSGFVPNEIEYSSLWGLTEQRFARLSRHTLVMHPGPMNRGLEIASAASDSDQSVIVKQVQNGVAVRMAVLHKLLARETSSK